MNSRHNPDRVAMLSPEAVELSLSVAGPSLRMLAYLIDFILVLVLWVGAFILAVMSISSLTSFDWGIEALRRLAEAQRDPASDAQVEDVLPTLFLIFVLFLMILYFVELGYFTFWETLTHGRTPGKALLRLRVVGHTGLPADFRAVFLRNVCRIVDLLPGNYLVGLIAMVASARGQRLGDMIAGTFVVRQERGVAPEVLELEGVAPLPLTREQAAKLGSPELELLRSTLRRIRRRRGRQRDRLVGNALEGLCRRLELDLGGVTDREAFLLRLLASAERQARLS